MVNSATADVKTLFAYQQEHVKKVLAHYQDNKVAIDLSPLGTGKTIAATTVARKLGVKHVVIVAPCAVLATWSSYESLEITGVPADGVPTWMVMSYSTLRSRTTCMGTRELSHRLLHRTDTRVENSERVITTFSTTAEFRRYVSEGALVVFDEFQNVKNKTSSQTDACRELVAQIVNNTAHSYALFISGSPFDKPEHVLSFFRFLGVFTEKTLAVVDLQVKKVHWRGFGEICDYCLEQADASGDDTIKEHVRAAIVAFQKQKYRMSRPNPSQRTFPMKRGVSDGVTRMADLALDMFITAVLPRISFFMKKPATSAATEMHVYNGMFAAPTDVVKTVRGYVSSLSDMVKQLSRRNESSESAMIQLKRINMTLMRLEIAKIGMFVRLAKKTLDDKSAGPRKVVLALNFLEPIHDIAAHLSAYKPLVVTGEIPLQARHALLQKFQSPSSEHRLLIGNLAVISTGIDLDNQHDTIPRVCFASPGWRAMVYYQLSYRFRRANSKSSAWIYMVYAAQCPEVNVLNTLAKKGALMRSVIEAQEALDIMMPNDYIPFVEEGALPADDTDVRMVDSESSDAVLID